MIFSRILLVTIQPWPQPLENNGKNEHVGALSKAEDKFLKYLFSILNINIHKEYIHKRYIKKYEYKYIYI